MAFEGLKAFDKGMCRLMSNQPMNSIFDVPRIIGKSFLQQGRKRIAGHEKLARKFHDNIDFTQPNGGLGVTDVAKSMFYKSSTGELSYKRVGAGVAGTAIAGSYILGGDD